MHLHIKNMVCNRCIMAVEKVLQGLDIPFESVHLGEVVLESDIGPHKKKELAAELEQFGFALIDDRKSRIIEKIKNTVIKWVHYADKPHHIKLSAYLADQLHLDYNYLSTLFSEVEGTTIEKFYIAQKIERVKELLVYDELTLSEIAWQMGYSSVAHLSGQFKKTTGLTPGHFRKIGMQKRRPLDHL